MAPAQERLAAVLDTLAFADPALGFVNNVDALSVTLGGECRDGLVRQVSAPVKWQQSIERLTAVGVDVFVEVGPGTVLSGLVKKIAKGARVLNVEDPESLAKAEIELGRG